MTLKMLKTKVQQLGELRAQKAELQASERALSNEVVLAMTADGFSSVDSADFTAQLAEQRRLVLDVKKFRRKAGEKIFLQCASIDLKEARLHFDSGQLEKLGSVESGVQLRISRRPA